MGNESKMTKLEIDKGILVNFEWMIFKCIRGLGM